MTSVTDLREFAFSMLEKAKELAVKEGNFITSAILVDDRGTTFEMKVMFKDDAERINAFQYICKEALNQHCAAVVIVSSAQIWLRDGVPIPVTERLGFAKKMLLVTVLAPACKIFTIAQEFKTDDAENFKFESPIYDCTLVMLENEVMRPFLEQKVHRA